MLAVDYFRENKRDGVGDGERFILWSWDRRVHHLTGIWFSAYICVEFGQVLGYSLMITKFKEKKTDRKTNKRPSEHILEGDDFIILKLLILTIVFQTNIINGLNQSQEKFWEISKDLL